MAFNFALSICVLVPFTRCSTKLILTSKSDGPVNGLNLPVTRFARPHGNNENFLYSFILMPSKYVLIISIILDSLGAYRYVLIILWSHVRPGTCFKPTRFHVEIGPRFGTDHYFTEIYKRRILISQCSVFCFRVLKGTCMYGLLYLFPF